jgi:methyl-accepting chemotaxis protein
MNMERVISVIWVAEKDMQVVGAQQARGLLRFEAAVPGRDTAIVQGILSEVYQKAGKGHGKIENVGSTYYVIGINAVAPVVEGVRIAREKFGEPVTTEKIRQAMENIKRIMTQAAYSTKEQAAGGRQVRMAVENMNKIASQVGIATREQAEGSRQIIRAVENMNSMTQEVSHATAEQKKGGELVVKAMENISEIARDNLSTVEEMSKATANLAQQAENLAKLVSVFRVQ